MRYVSDTKGQGLLYRDGVAKQLVLYTDADWADDATDRRSTFGFTFSLGSATVAWSSKKKPIVALSSIEVEYRGATVTSYEARWLRRLLQDLRIKVPTPILIYCDNINNMQLPKNPYVPCSYKAN